MYYLKTLKWSLKWFGSKGKERSKRMTWRIVLHLSTKKLREAARCKFCQALLDCSLCESRVDCLVQDKPDCFCNSVCKQMFNNIEALNAMKGAMDDFNKCMKSAQCSLKAAADGLLDASASLKKISTKFK